MGFLSQVRGEKSPVAAGDVEGSNGGGPEDQHNKEAGPEPQVSETDDTSTHKQDGVREIEAITSVWSKKTLWLMMIL